MVSDAAIDDVGISANTLLFIGILCLIFIIMVIILLVKLSRSMKQAAQDNARINQYLAAIPETKIGTINAVYQNTKKELGTALTLAVLFGSMGGHKIYLGQAKSAILYFIFCWSFIPAILRWFDVVRMPKIISAYNLSIVESLYAQIAAPQVGKTHPLDSQEGR